MPIKISATLRKKLPASEKDSIDSALIGKSGGVCFLCGEKIIESAEELVADHDLPESEGGTTELSNLNLVHDSCNSFKRAHPTINVRPYLKLVSKIKAKGGFLKYDEAVNLLEIKPKAVDIVISSDSAKITMPDGTTRECPVLSETNREKTYKFCFCDLPAETIFNDDECQPRTVKIQHLWQIYSDVARNPLHEAPACRVMKVSGSQRTHELLLFDGQHKALSFWVDGRKSVATKIYLDISKDDAVRLINSVQAKIKKLPLSPFELAAKMADEWRERAAKYESDVGTAKASEAGFLKWVQSDERTRAKAALEEAILDSIAQDGNPDIANLVSRHGDSKASASLRLTEAAFRNKVLKPLVHITPLSEPFSEGQKLRERELNNIVMLLNVLYTKAFAIAHPSPQDEIRKKRLLYQSAMSFTTTMLRRIMGHRLAVSEPRQLLEKEPDAEMRALIETDIATLLDHPVWTAAFDSSPKMAAVQDSLSKNQDAAQAFNNVGLKLGYVIRADALDPEWNA